MALGTALAIGGATLAGSLLGGKSKTKVEDIRTPQQMQADKYLADLLQQADPELPAEKIAGLSENEQLAEQMAQQYGTSEAEGLDVLRGILGESDDVTQDPSIKALLEVLDERGSREANRLSRGLTLRGVTGGAGQDALGRGLQDIQNNILATLAPYAESAKNRRVSAAQILNQLGEGSTLNRLNALGGTGALSRQIEQLQNTAKYNQIMQQLLFPYKEKAQIASSLSAAQGNNLITQTPSLGSQFAPIAAMVAQAAMTPAAGAQTGTTNAAANQMLYKHW